jgi:hypothetical protein
MHLAYSAPEKFHHYDRLEWHLLNWARYMRTGSMVNFHVHGGTGLNGYPQHYDTDVEYDKSDAYTARSVDAAIRSLQRLEELAIHSEYLNAKWTSEKPLNDILDKARANLQILINKRCLL